jgi:hypothetical protein
MTLHTMTATVARCDGTMSSACDALHPDRPHQCTATLALPNHDWNAYVLDHAGWTIGPVDTTAPGSSLRRHYCPTHRDQATHQPPTWAEATGLPLDH